MQATRKDLSRVGTMSAYDFYAKLLPLEAGKKPETDEEEQETAEMKQWLYQNFGTYKVSTVDKEALKKELEGPALLERINHRKAVAVNYKKEAVAKYAVLRRENKQASTLSAAQRNDFFGFSCLHYSVSEASGSLKIKILNKSGKPGSVMFRTIDGEAKGGTDYKPLDTRVSF